MVINGMRLKTAYSKMVVRYVLEPKVGIELNMLKVHTRILPTHNHNDMEQWLLARLAIAIV